MRKVELMPTRDCEAGYGPGYFSRVGSKNILGVVFFFILFYMKKGFVKFLIVRWGGGEGAKIY